MTEDVLIQILLWLPVISLLRFKSVSKSWRSIIESTFFINLHATTTTKSGGSSSSFLFNRGEEHKGEENKGKLFTLSGDEFEVFEDLGRPPLVDLGEEFEELNRTFEGFVKFCVMSCCDGIICLHDNFSRNTILWNPAIKQSRVVPKPSNLLGNPICCDRRYLNIPHDTDDDDDDDAYYADDVVIFGVDFKTKDYKVLLITTLQPHQTYDDEDMMKSPGERRVHIYSLSTDSWRCIDMITLSDAYPDLQINRYVIQGLDLMSGNLFFMAVCQIKVQDHFCTMPLILSFDLTKENFKTIQLPFDWRKRNAFENKWNYFVPFGEKLAVADVSECECNVWVLNEQQHSGVKESWTKLYTLEHSYMSLNQLLCIANNTQFAIINWIDPCQNNVRKLRLLNLFTGETKDLQSDCHGLQVDSGCGIYRPNLLQIGRSGATNEKCT